MANNSTDLGQSKYDFRYLTFPDDIGADYVGHYMVININVPTKGFSLTAPNTNDAAGNYTHLFSELKGAQARFSKVDTLRYLGTLPNEEVNQYSGYIDPRNWYEEASRLAGRIKEAVVGGNRYPISIPRQTKRIAESIALFMPQGLAFTDQNDYQSIDMSAYAGGPIASAAVAAAGGAAGVAVAAAGIVDSVGQSLSTLSAVMGNPINPGVEVIYSTKRLRTFSLDFLMAPRNRKESENLKSIIKTLRFHASPEINTNTLGATWIPPADFDITFFKHGVENLHIQRINTCILERMDVVYDPSGAYSTFSNGHPVSVRMTLHFQEVEPIHKLRILQGF